MGAEPILSDLACSRNFREKCNPSETGLGNLDLSARRSIISMLWVCIWSDSLCIEAKMTTVSANSRRSAYSNRFPAIGTRGCLRLCRLRSVRFHFVVSDRSYDDVLSIIKCFFCNTPAPILSTIMIIYAVERPTTVLILTDWLICSQLYIVTYIAVSVWLQSSHW